MEPLAVSASLSISVVSFAPEFTVLGDTLRSLAATLAHARGAGRLGAAKVWIVDNGPGDRWTAALRDLAHSELAAQAQSEILAGHGNVGYGRAHNIAIRASEAEYHLVLNPDVRLNVDAVAEAIGFMQANPGVAMLAPQARDAAGAPQFLCKRYPSVFDLLLRGFAPERCRRRFDARLARYEMRDLPQNSPTLGVPVISGSFMFCRRAALAALGGFSDAFFMYFEDFDLSLRAQKLGEIAYVPAVRIVHLGGGAARKGPRHLVMFAHSALTFFNRHGWKWA